MHDQGLLFRRAEAILLKEKVQKLFGLTKLLDARLPIHLLPFLESSSLENTQEQRETVTALNEELTRVSDDVAAAFPGVGLGYYARNVDAIVTYSPSGQFGNKVGISVQPDHIGRRAMRERRQIAGVGSMVRGDILNCVSPLIREGEVLGFMWANETVEDIYRQLQQGESTLFFSSDDRINPLLGLSGLLTLVTSQLAHNSRVLKQRSEGGMVDELRVVNEMYRSTRSYLKMFLNTVGSAIVIQEQSTGKAIFCNTAAEELFGRLGLDLSTQSLWEGFRAFGAGHLRQQVRQMRARGIRHSSLQISLLLGPSASHPVDLQIVTVGEGEGTHILYILDDPEEARRQEEYRARASKLAAAGEVAVAVAHEIRNPLAIIRGSVQLIPDRLNDRAFLMRFAEVLLQEIDHVNDTLESLLTFTRVAEPQFGAVNLVKLIADTVEMTERYARENKVQVDLYQSDEEIVMQADGRYLGQALLNLIVNGVQAMPEGGRLVIRCTRRPESRLAEITVEDTGVGIAVEDQAKVFDVFFTKRPDGAGLGLALVQRIIDAHQGFIRIDSAVGKGTSITITLPVDRYDFEPNVGRVENGRTTNRPHR